MKKGLIAGVAMATAMFFAAPAAAQVTFTGSTAGCFGAGCDPTTGTSTLGTLTFTSSTFNQTTDMTGFLSLGGNPDGLGTFSLGTSPRNFTGDVFSLLVNFTAPSATDPSGSVFSALLTGAVTNSGGGSVFFNFDDTARLFTSSAGPFSLLINDIGVSAGSSGAIISGQLQAAVPEPGTWAMMLLGFGAIGYSMRRRRKPILQLA